MAVNLPTDLLRSFAAIVDSGSMLRATEKVFLTQSALSLQMKRLEDQVQAPLFHRDGRRLSLTPAGGTLLVFAREILAANDRAVSSLNGDMLAGPARVGMVQDFAETLLSSVLSQFSQLNPEAQLQMRVGGTLELLDLLRSDRLDVVLGMGSEDDPASLRTAPMRWLGDPGLTLTEVLPLAVLERPCRFRDAALAALDAAGRPYRILLETPSLSVLRACVDSNLAITCRTEVFSSRVIGAGEGASLPSLPKVAYVRHTRGEPHPTIGRLAELISAAVLSV
ncbi:MAG: LysR substrate-binding domain-containing protein [Caulobacteraceae bacterium]